MNSMNRKMVLLVLGILLCLLMVVPACDDGTDDILVGALGDDLPGDDDEGDDEGDEDEDGEEEEDGETDL